MKRVEASVAVPGPVEAVEALWLDPARWPAWIDAQLSGTQSATFAAETDGALRVRLLLAYELKDANPFTPLVDVLYIRRALRASLQRSLARFSQERIADSELGG